MAVVHLMSRNGGRRRSIVSTSSLSQGCNDEKSYHYQVWYQPACALRTRPFINKNKIFKIIDKISVIHSVSEANTGNRFLDITTSLDPVAPI